MDTHPPSDVLMVFLTGGSTRLHLRGSVAGLYYNSMFSLYTGPGKSTFTLNRQYPKIEGHKDESESPDSSSQHQKVQLPDFPGRVKAFELCAKFRYEITITLRPYNIVAARLSIFMSEQWNSLLASNKRQDFYDISLVDGFNLLLFVIPQGGLKGCNRTSCPSDVNTVCLPNFVVEGSDGSVIAYKSARLALDQPEYCCIRPFASANKCPPTPF
ncbi:hypothetical protein VNO78_21731 [Psophocarpus tetragonolobus]|uniref:Uncharacterized protein n=1 Tax=Psophocarpus tetragonolobus TaxID=3891 RepID=A0AAN9XIB7_PSOTE